MRTSRRSLVTALAATMAALLALAAAPALELTPSGATGAGGPDGDDPHVASSNMSWVANVQYPVTDNNSQAGTTDVQGGTDLELVTLDTELEDGTVEPRDYALSGTYENGFQVVDVTDPEAPFLAGTYDCDIYQGDVQVWTHEGRTFTTYGVDYSAEADSDCFTDLQGTPGHMAALQNANLGALIIEVTDPLHPRSVGFIPADGGTHNGTVRGFDTTGDGQQDAVYFYNSENDTAGSLTVWNITDVTAPTKVASLPLQDAGADTHDVTFNEAGDRAYVASINLSYILDTTDPANPVLVSRIIDPAVGIHHQADPLTLETPLGERTYMIISDEIAGAAGNGFCPGGGIHVWDVTVEQAPVKVGAYFMPDVTVQEGANTGQSGLISCTAHVFRLYPEQGIMTIGNMAGGVRVIDVTDLIGVSVGDENTSTGSVAGMNDLGWFRFTNGDITGSDSWAFKVHPERFAEDGSFYAFSNDQTRGFEVFHFDATEPAAEAASGEAERGWWATPEQALQRFQQLDLDTDALVYSCRFPGGLRGAVPTA